MKTGHSSKPFAFYSRLMRKQVHLLLAWGYNNIKDSMDTDDEEEISDLIYQGIKNILRSGNKQWFEEYAVKNEDPISGGKRKGKKRREIDLIIEFTKNRRPEYVFEAKPLNYSKNYQRTGNYIGNDGMKRFLKGEYADYTANYPEIGMIGYILSDTPKIWRDRLKKAIEGNKDKLQLIPPQSDVKVIDEFPLEWLSNHKRNSVGNPMAIYHILLDCCVDV